MSEGCSPDAYRDCGLRAEIKRLRELGKSSLDFYIASIKFQHRNNQLIADTAREWIDEAERLEGLLAAKDDLNNDLMANCNQLRNGCWKAESELARFQKR